MPKIARTLGRGMRQIKDATQGIQRDIQDSVMDTESGIGNTVKDIKPFEDMEKPISDISKPFKNIVNDI